MYIEDKFKIAIIDILLFIILFILTIANIINIFTNIALIILIGIITKLYIAIKESKYKRDMHDNLENIAKKQ